MIGLFAFMPRSEILRDMCALSLLFLETFRNSGGHRQLTDKRFDTASLLFLVSFSMAGPLLDQFEYLIVHLLIAKMQP